MSASTLTAVAVPHPSPSVNRTGFDLGHEYVERCWTSRLGCSAVLLLRRLAAEFTDAEVVELDLPDLAGSLGLKWSEGRRTTLRNVVDRLVRFGFAQWVDGELHVPVTVPPLSNRQLDQVPQRVRDDHHLLLGVWLDGLAVHA